MKSVKIACALLLSSAVMSSCSSDSCSKNVEVESKMDSVSYALGFNQGLLLSENLKNLPGDTLDKDLFLAAFAKGLMGDSATSKMTKEEAVDMLQGYFAELQKKEEERMQAEAIFNKLKGDSVLAANKAMEGVVETSSGLQYRVIKAGEGKKPSAKDVVRVHYEGKTIDGKVFDSSYERGNPAEFPVEGVIPGWTEALQLMPVGSKWELLIPSNLAYGERGAGPDILPNSVLRFEVELLDILPKK